MNRHADFSLRQNLKTLLQKRGLKISELARLSGVSKSVLSNWLGDQKPGDIRKVNQVAGCLGVTIDELCFGTEVESRVTTSDSRLESRHMYLGQLYMADDQSYFDVIIRRRAESL